MLTTDPKTTVKISYTLPSGQRRMMWLDLPKYYDYLSAIDAARIDIVNLHGVLPKEIHIV